MNITDSDPAAQRQRPISPGFRPLDDRILVHRLDDVANKQVLFMPECVWTQSKRGLVIAVGPGKRDSDGFRRPLDVKPGDVIYFGRFTDYDDGNLLLVTESDIVGVVCEADSDP